MVHPRRAAEGGAGCDGSTRYIGWTFESNYLFRIIFIALMSCMLIKLKVKESEKDGLWVY